MERMKTASSRIDRRRARALAAGSALALAVFVLVALATPVPAHADGWDALGGVWDAITGALEAPGKAITGIINGALAQVLCANLNTMTKVISQTISISSVNKTFSALITTNSSGGVPAVYTLVKTVANTVVQPCAFTILSITTLVQFLVIAKRMDQGTPELATLREVFTLFCWLAIMSFLIAHAFDLVREAYNLVNAITSAVIRAAGDVGKIEQLKTINASKIGVDANTDSGALLVCVLISLMGVCFALFTVVTSWMMIFARGLEVYLLAAFSPLPFAFLSLDATRQWGGGYIKQFLTVSFQGVMIVLLLAFFPVLMESLVANAFTAKGVSDFVSGESFDYVTAMLKLCAGLYVMNKSMTKTGQIAANVFGG